MKRLLSSAAIVLVLNWALIPPAASAAGRFVPRIKGHGAVASPDDDGLAGAPSGAAIMFPAWKSTVAHPPAWNVPDVNFGAGPHGGTVFGDPTTIAFPTLAYYAPTNTVYCNGPGNSLHAFDFRMHGGVNLIVQTLCDDFDATDNMFGKGTNCANVLVQNTGDGGALRVRFLFNDFDGGGAAARAACLALGADGGETLQFLSDGLKVVQYNRIHDFEQHAITYGGLHTSIDDGFNSVFGCGFDMGEHCNTRQFSNVNVDLPTGFLKFHNNFGYDPQPTVSWTTPAAKAAFVIGTNTVAITLDASNQGSFRTGQHLTSSKISGTVVVCAVSDPANGPPVTITLTLDTTDTSCTHPANATSSGATTATIPDMWPIGKVIDYKGFPDGSNTLANFEYSMNVLAGPGPIKGSGYAIYCFGTSGTFKADKNYIDLRNYSGLFNVGGGDCSPGQRSGSGNIDMGTGATIPVP